MSNSNLQNPLQAARRTKFDKLLLTYFILLFIYLLTAIILWKWRNINFAYLIHRYYLSSCCYYIFILAGIVIYFVNIIVHWLKTEKITEDINYRLIPDIILDIITNYHAQDKVNRDPKRDQKDKEKYNFLYRKLNDKVFKKQIIQNETETKHETISIVEEIINSSNICDSFGRLEEKINDDDVPLDQDQDKFKTIIREKQLAKIKDYIESLENSDISYQEYKKFKNILGECFIESQILTFDTIKNHIYIKNNGFNQDFSKLLKSFYDNEKTSLFGLFFHDENITQSFVKELSRCMRDIFISLNQEHMRRGQQKMRYKR